MVSVASTYKTTYIAEYTLYTDEKYSEQCVTICNLEPW